MLLVSISFSFDCQKSLDIVSFKYLGFDKYGNSSSLKLLFLEIKNNSSDTLYLSKKNIIIKVLKKNKKINNKDNKSIGQIFYKPTNKNKSKIDIENAQEKQTAILRHNFAKKIFHKNFKKNKSKENEDFIIQIIENDCIVILPNKSVNHGIIFNNDAFDNSCNVNFQYEHNKRFTFFENGKDKVINIYN